MPLKIFLQYHILALSFAQPHSEGKGRLFLLEVGVEGDGPPPAHEPALVQVAQLRRVGQGSRAGGLPGHGDWGPAAAAVLRRVELVALVHLVAHPPHSRLGGRFKLEWGLPLP